MFITIERLATNIASKFRKGGPRNHLYTLAISGFPTSGKTMLAKRIQELLPALTVVEAEFWIKDFEERMRLNASGASLEAYEVQEAVASITKLRQGAEIQVMSYSHFTKKRSGPAYIIRPAAEDGLVLDGCIFADALFRPVIDYHVCIIPSDVLEWYQNCVYRDMKERHFDLSFSKWHTKRKFVDMLNILGQQQLKIDELLECSGNLGYDETTLYYESIHLSRISNLYKEGQKLCSMGTN